MITESYKEGFVEQCLDSGLQLEQTQELLKKATFAHGFEDSNFLEGFENIHGEGSAMQLSPLEKAQVVETALANMVNDPSES